MLIHDMLKQMCMLKVKIYIDVKIDDRRSPSFYNFFELNKGVSYLFARL